MGFPIYIVYLSPHYVAMRRSPSCSRPPSSSEKVLSGLLSLLFLCTLPQLPPFVTPTLLRATSNCLDATPSMCHDRLPELSEFAGAMEGGGAAVMEVPESVGGLEDEGAVNVA